MATQEACRTAAFQALPVEGVYRFAQRNIQDWLTAFRLARLSPSTLVSVLRDETGRLHPRLKETARLIRLITSDPNVQEVVDQFAESIILSSDVIEPSLNEVLTCLDRLEGLALRSDWALRLSIDGGEGLGRLEVPGLPEEIVKRLTDPNRPHQVKQLLLEVAEATQAVDVADPAVELSRVTEVL
jgi:hypothetical protein